MQCTAPRLIKRLGPGVLGMFHTLILPLMFRLLCLFLSVCRIVLSTPLAVLTYFLIWYVPPFEDGKVIWYLFFYCGFQTLQTVSAATRAHDTHTHTLEIYGVYWMISSASLLQSRLG